MSYLRIRTTTLRSSGTRAQNSHTVYTVRWNNGVWKLFSPWSYADTGVFHTKNDAIRVAAGQFHR
jgi:hypothetical protein